MINRLRDLMTSVFPSLERAFDYSAHKGALVLLTGYASPDRIRRIGQTRLADWLRNRRVRGFADVAVRAITAAKAQSVVLPGQDLSAAIIAELASAILTLDERVKTLSARLDPSRGGYYQTNGRAWLGGIGIRMNAAPADPRKAKRHSLARYMLAAGLILVLFIGAAKAISLTRCTHGCRPSTGTAAPGPDEPASLTLEPAPGARDLDPVAPVSVTAQTGTLTDVVMVNDAGKRIDSALTPDAKSWHPVVPLGYGRTYTLTISSRGPGGKASTQQVSFSTLTPPNQTKVSLETTSEAPLQDATTYGVGTVIVAHFDEPITDKAEAERRLKVTTSPPVAGSWNWVDDQHAHWRPEHYYAPNTSVTLDANLYGIQLAQGVFGQQDEHVKVTIGESHVSVADDHTHQVSVYRNGALVRTMPTSMGMGGTQQIGGRTLSFWTPPGVYTVLDKGNPVVMDSSTFGLPKNSRLGYRETINYATRISTDGIYLHQLDATVWAQGNTDTSHGCLNLNGDNAKWFYDFSIPGDVVEVRNTGGPPLTLEQNGDWTIPWDQWRKGSALN